MQVVLNLARRIEPCAFHRRFNLTLRSWKIFLYYFIFYYTKRYFPKRGSRGGGGG